MRVRLITYSFAALSALVFAASSANAQGHSPLGVWYDHDGRGAVEIKKCGSKLCGRLVWAKSRKDAKKGCGKLIIKNVRKVGKSTWDGGRIYSPEKGRSYDVELKTISANKLRVLGYMGSKLFSQTMIWKRAPANLERCDKQNAPIEAKKKTTPAPVVTKKVATKKPVATKKVAKKKKVTAPSALGAPAKAKATAKAKASTPPKTTTAKVEPPPPPMVAPKPSRAERMERDPATAAREQDIRDEKENAAVDEPITDKNTRRDKIASVDANDDDFESDDDDTSGSTKGFCKLEVPFVTISFPCKK